MIKTIYTAIITLIQYVRPLRVLNKCVDVSMNKRVQKTKSSKNSSSLILHPELPVPLTQAAGRCVAN